VLTGHIHGGQIIIPGKGGLISPDVEFFPEYYDGLYELGGECNTRMIVSRGIGNSVLPLRINNYPELVVVTVR
jgi:predicted MPP superfamily phosphohydrolase